MSAALPSLLDALPLLLVFARVLPLALVLASLSRALVPPAVALSASLALALALVPLAMPAATSAPLSHESSAVLLGLLRELCIGGVFALSLGAALSALGWAVRMSQGPGTLAAVDPFARAYVLCAGYLVLSLGGLRALVIGLAESFRDAGLGGTKLDGRALALGAAQLVADALASALGFALPLLLGVWLLEASLGLIARVLGQGALVGASLLRPLVFFFAAAALLVPVTSHAPEAVRAAIASARALTQALAR